MVYRNKMLNNELKDLTDGHSLLSSGKNPSLKVVRDNGKRRWFNRCYFKITSGNMYNNKTIFDFSYFATYEKGVYRGTHDYNTICNLLTKTYDECTLIAYPRHTLKRRLIKHKEEV